MDKDLSFVILLAAVTKTLREGTLEREDFERRLRTTVVAYLDEKDVSAGERLSTLKLLETFVATAGLAVGE